MDLRERDLPSLRQLEQFLVLGEELHFGRAAQRLGMHQAPLSQAIQKLEVELRLQLFERSHRYVALTPAGAALLPEARSLVEGVEAFAERARRLADGAVGAISVGFVSTAIYSVLPALLLAFRERYPEVELRLREATTDVQIELLLRGEIDVGLLIEGTDAAIRGISTQPVRTDRLIAAVPASWDAGRYRASQRNGADLAILAREELISVPRHIGPALFDAVLASFETRGIEPRFGQEGIQMQTILGLVGAGLGYAIVPESMRTLARSDVRYLEIAGETSAVVLSVGWRLRDPNPIVQNFVQLARSLQEADSESKRDPSPTGRNRIERRSGPDGSISTSK
jgi:DNA-binding transcriptional LysR family regulator